LVETEDQHNAGASARVQSWFEEAGYVASVATSGGFVKLSEKASAHNRNRLFRPIQRMYSGSISETTQDAEYNYNL
jgi:hypothetical protein